MPNSRFLIVVAGAAGLGMVFASSCKKQKAPESAPIADAYERVDTAPLWKLVPADAQAAVVMSEGSLAPIHRAAIRIVSDLRGAPGGNEVVEKMYREDPKVAMVLAPGVARTFGGDLSKGLAVYVLKDEVVVALVPITDPAKLREFAKGRKEGDLDVYKKIVCKPHSGLYACAEKAEHLETIGRGGGMKPPEAAMQGHIEAYVGQELASEMQTPPLSPIRDVRGIRSVVRLEPGGMSSEMRLAATVDAALQVDPKTPLLSDVAQKSPSGVVSIRGTKLWERYGRELAQGFPKQPLPGGVTADELIAPLTGDIAGYALTGALGGAMRIGVNDTAPYKKVLASCEQLGGLPDVSAKLENGRCTVTLTGPDDLKVTGVAWADGNAVHLGFGDFEGKREPVAIGRMASELIDGQWLVGGWGYGAYFASPEFDTLKTDAIYRTADEEAKLGFWALFHVVEYGFALRFDPDEIVGKMRFRTTWSYKNEVGKTLEPLLARMAGGDWTAAADVRALAKKHPSSKLAQDIKGNVGVAAPFSIFGIAAAVAIPAFMKYIKKSKMSEARQFIKKISDGARAFAMDGGTRSFPKVSTPMTPPAGSCCKGGTKKCTPDAAIWNHPTWAELKFSVDDQHYYSYQYEVAPDGKKYTARAIGDLDCDGEYSTFEVYGELTDDGPIASPNVYRENELE